MTTPRTVSLRRKIAPPPRHSSGHGLRALVLPLIFLLLTGCLPRQVELSFIRPDYDFSYLDRIAVLPFANNSADKYIGEMLRDITSTQLLAGHGYDLVDKGIVDSAIAEERTDPQSDAPLDQATLKRLGQRLRVKAFCMGQVDMAREIRQGNYGYPVLSVTLRLVDADSAQILWQATGSHDGASVGRRLLGVASKPVFHIGTELIRKMLRALPDQRGTGNQE